MLEWKEVKKEKNKNKLAKKKGKEKEPTDAERTEKKEQRKMLELKEVKRKKKTNKPATEKRKERKKIVSRLQHSCNFYLSLLFKLCIIVKDLF